MKFYPKLVNRPLLKLLLLRQNIVVEMVYVPTFKEAITFPLLVKAVTATHVHLRNPFIKWSLPLDQINLIEFKKKHPVGSCVLLFDLTKDRLN